MLIQCQECNGKVSDKAVSCPHCGFPITSSNISEDKPKKAVKKASRAHMKLPNNFGSIKKLSGNRRRPYAVYPPIRQADYDDNGKPPKVKALGYFETWYDAYDYLSKNNINGGFSKTFAEIYKKFYEKKFNNPLKPMSESRETLYEWVYTYFCKDLYNKPITSITSDDLQLVINKAFVEAPSSAEMLKTLFNQIYAYAIIQGLAEIDISKKIDIPQYKSEPNEPLVVEEIQRMWQHTDHKHVRTALILCYSGLRIEELEITTIDLEKKVFIGGNKTEAGRNKIVPIHPCIYEFVEQFDQKAYKHDSWRKTGFGKVVELAQLDTVNKKCTPHSLRHTFSWLWDRDVKTQDELAKHLVMGHKLKGDDVEVNTYGHRTVEQLRECVEQIRPDK